MTIIGIMLGVTLVVVPWLAGDALENGAAPRRID
jgi:hypothetical protein